MSACCHLAHQIFLQVAATDKSTVAHAPSCAESFHKRRHLATRKKRKEKQRCIDKIRVSQARNNHLFAWATMPPRGGSTERRNSLQVATNKQSYWPSLGCVVTLLSVEEQSAVATWQACSFICFFAPGYALLLPAGCGRPE